MEGPGQVNEYGKNIRCTDKFGEVWGKFGDQERRDVCEPQIIRRKLGDADSPNTGSITRVVAKGRPVQHVVRDVMKAKSAERGRAGKPVQ